MSGIVLDNLVSETFQETNLLSIEENGLLENHITLFVKNNIYRTIYKHLFLNVTPYTYVFDAILSSCDFS